MSPLSPSILPAPTASGGGVAGASDVVAAGRADRADRAHRADRADRGAPAAETRPFAEVLDEARGEARANDPRAARRQAAEGPSRGPKTSSKASRSDGRVRAADGDPGATSAAAAAPVATPLGDPPRSTGDTESGQAGSAVGAAPSDPVITAATASANASTPAEPATSVSSATTATGATPAPTAAGREVASATPAGTATPDASANATTVDDGARPTTRSGRIDQTAPAGDRPAPAAALGEASVAPVAPVPSPAGSTGPAATSSAALGAPTVTATPTPTPAPTAALGAPTVAGDDPAARTTRRRGDRANEAGRPALTALGEATETTAAVAPDPSAHAAGDDARTDGEPHASPGIRAIHGGEDGADDPADTGDASAARAGDAKAGAPFTGRALGQTSAASVEAPTRTARSRAAAADQVLAQVVDRLRTFRTDGVPGVETRFDDPQLGAIHLVVTGRPGETLQAELVASSSHAADALNRALGHLVASASDPLHQIEIRIRTGDPSLGLDRGSSGSRHGSDPRDGSMGWAGDGSASLGHRGRHAGNEPEPRSIDLVERPAARSRTRSTTSTTRTIPVARPTGHGVDLRA